MFQVNKIEVQYDKTSKQVDVHALKETLWGQIQESTEVPEPVSLFFSLVVDSFLTQVCVCLYYHSLFKIFHWTCIFSSLHRKVKLKDLINSEV